MSAGLCRRYHRIKRQQDFDLMFRAAPRFKRGRVVLFVRPNGTAVSRSAVCVPKKVGKAVKRNRIRRIMYEVLRRHWNRIRPGLDLMVLVRDGAQELAWADANEVLSRLLRAGGCLSNGPGESEQHGQSRSEGCG